MPIPGKRGPRPGPVKRKTDSANGHANGHAPEDAAPAEETAPVEEAASQPSPAAGHNSGESSELTDDQKQILWFAAKRKIKALKLQMDSLNGDLRNEYKRLKADLGVTRKDVEFALSLDDDSGEAMDSHRRRMMLARWEQHPIGTQADLFGDGIDRTPAVDKKRAEGRQHGLTGQDCNPGCDPSTEQYSAYLEGLHEGAAARNEALLRGGMKPLAEDDGAPWPDDAAIADQADALDELAEA